MKYYIVSLKHTSKKDKYLTLWRPDNKGYCWPMSLAGVYEDYEPGYHNDEGNTPVPPGALWKFIIYDEEHRPCIKNCKASREEVLSYKNILTTAELFLKSNPNPQT
jgi:hypothetical protein